MEEKDKIVNSSGKGSLYEWSEREYFGRVRLGKRMRGVNGGREVKDDKNGKETRKGLWRREGEERGN